MSRWTEIKQKGRAEDKRKDVAARKEAPHPSAELTPSPQGEGLSGRRQTEQGSVSRWERIKFSGREKDSGRKLRNDFAAARDFTENYGARAAASSMPEVSERDRRDAAVRNNYAERLQAEQDARYAGYNVAEAEARLNNPGYWMQKIRESRSAGNGFEGDNVILAERDALEKEVAEARAAQERNRVRSFARIPQNADFAQHSVGGFYGNYDPRKASPAKYGEMTDEEVRVWRYLANKERETPHPSATPGGGGVENGRLVAEFPARDVQGLSAEEYLQSLENELVQRRGVKMGVKARTIDNPIGRGAAALGLAALSGIKSPIEGTVSALTGEETEQDVLDYAAGYVRNDIDGALGVAYDLTQSTANMVPSILLGSLTGVPALGIASMGVSAAGNAYSDALRDGYSKGQAALYGGIVGASEAALQNILGGIGALGGKMSATSVLKKLVEKIPRAGLRAAVKLAGSGVSEATEEGLQTYIEAGLRKVIFDENFNLRDVSEDALYSAMLGALSAGLLEGPGVVAETYLDNDIKSTRKNTVASGADLRYNEGSEGSVVNGREDDSGRNQWLQEEVSRESDTESDSSYGKTETGIFEQGSTEEFGRAGLLSQDNEGKRIKTEDFASVRNSVVKDETGRLRAVYHYTPEAEFTSFGKSNDIGFHFGSENQAMGRQKDLGTKSGRTFRVYLNLKNPIRVSEDIMGWKAHGTALKLWSDGVLTDSEMNEVTALDVDGYDSPAAVRLREILAEKGYDGIVYPNGFEGDGESYIAFSDEQIIKTEIRNVSSDGGTTDASGRINAPFGESGSKAIRAVLPNPTPEQYRAFAQVYNISAEGRIQDENAAGLLESARAVLSPEAYYAAEAAGRNDAEVVVSKKENSSASQRQRDTSSTADAVPLPLKGKAPGKMQSETAQSRSATALPRGATRRVGEVVRDDNYKRARLTSREGRILDALAKVTGTRVRFVETIKNGETNDNAEYSDGEIRIALDSDDPVRVAVVHEVIHRLKEISPESYRKLSDFVFNNLTEDELELLRKDFGSGYKELSPDGVSEEIVAQAFGVIMGDRNRIDALIRDDRGTWEKICDIINDLIISIRRALSGERAAQISEYDREAFSGLLKKAEEMERVLREALETADTRFDAKAEKNTARAVKHSIKRDLRSKLQEIFIHKGNDGNEVLIGTTSDFLVNELGADPLQVTMPKNKAYAAMATEEEARSAGRYDSRLNYHGLGVDLLYEALEASENPVVAFVAEPEVDKKTGKLEDRSDRIVLVTDKKKDGNNIVVIMQVNAKGMVDGGRLEVNKEITVYDRNSISSDISKAIADNRLLHFDKKRSQTISAGDKASNSPSAIQKVDFKDNIARFWANVKWKKEGSLAQLEAPGTETGTAMEEAFSKALEENVNTKSSRKRNEEERGRIYELERENKKQKKLIEQLRERMRGLDKKVIRGAVDRKEARRATRELINRYGGEINPRELAPELQELWDGIGTGRNLIWEDIHAKAQDIARRIAESSIERDDTKYRDFADLRKFCRENTFTISESDRSDIPDFNDFRKRNMGRIRIAYGETDIDTQYRILSDMFPGMFDEEISRPADQLQHIAKVLGDVYDIKERSRFDSNMDYAVGKIANDILETFYEIPETKKTLKDLKIEKLTRTVAEKTNSERNAVKELEKYKKTAEREAEELQQAYNKARLESAREKEKLRESKEKFYDEKRKQETRGKIIRGIDRLSRLAMRPSDKSHIPEGLRGAVKGFLGCINLSSEWAIDANTGHVVKRLPADMERRELLPIKREVRYEELLAMFLDAEEEFAIPTEFLRSDVDTPYLLEVSKLSNKSVYEMDIDELNKVWRTVQIIEAAIRNGNRAFAFKSYEGIEELAEAVKRDNKFTAERINLGKLEGIVNLVKTGMMKPITFFHMMGKTGDEIFYRLAEAEKAKDRRIREMKKKTAEIRRGLDIYALEKEGHDITLGGQRVRVSTAQIMELYALSRRKQGLSHILNGGIKPQAFLERGKSLKEAETVKDRVGAVMGKTYTKAIEDITEEEIGKAVALLSDEQKKVAEGLQRYLSTDVSEMMNNACLQVFGYKKFLEKVYWPIRTDETERGAEEGKARKKKTTPAISSLGMTKATTPQGAGTPILLGSAFDTFSRHCEEAASYAEKLAVTEDIRRLRRHRYAIKETTNAEKTDAKKTEAKKTEAKTFAQVVEGIFGRAGNEYWDRLDENIASGTDRTGNADNPFSGATTANKAAAVSLNMRVWMQQVFSVLRAMGRINPLYIPGGVYRPIHGWKKALKYSEVARKKGSGFSDVNTGPAMKSILFEQKTFSEKIRDWGMAPAGWMDSVGWGILWNACELEVKADMEKEAKGKRPDSGLAGVKAGSELFYEIVCERFEREIYRSQVFDGILQRSHTMRSGNELVNMATSFMSESTTAVNDVYIAAIDVARAETSKEKRAARAKFARVLTAELVQIVAVAALGQGLWDAIRDDDKEKSYWEKWFEHTKDNIADQLNPFGYFPFIKDALSAFNGFDANRMDMAIVGEAVTVIKNFGKVINGESKYTLAEVSAQAFATAGSVLGIGTRNLKRDVQAVLRSIAVESGNFLFEYRLEKGMLNMNYKDNGTTFYDILYRAYEKDSDAYEIIYADMIKNGMEEKKIMAAMEDRMKKRAGVKEVSELEARYLPPEKQKKYSETLSPVKSTEVWKTASPAQRKDLEEDVYNLTALNDDGEKLRDKMNEAAKYGIDTTQYLLYLLACDVVDKPNKSGKLGGAPTSKEFKEAALLAGLSKKERDYLWEQLHPGE